MPFSGRCGILKVPKPSPGGRWQGAALTDEGRYRLPCGTAKLVYRTEAEEPSFLALSARGLGPSGGPFLVPPRKGERMRLKGGADRCLLPPQSRPPLRILPGALLRQKSNVSATFYRSIQDVFVISSWAKLYLCFHRVKTLVIALRTRRKAALKANMVLRPGEFLRRAALPTAPP